MPMQRNVHIVTDTGCSYRPEDAIVREHGIQLIPLQLSILDNGSWTPKQETEIAPGQFYSIMARMIREDGELPRTSGVNPGIARETYLRLLTQENTAGIVSVHITAAHSQAMNAARLGAREALQTYAGNARIEVVDSQQLTIGQWWLAAHAAQLAAQGAPLEQIAAEVKEMRTRVQVLAVLENFENLKRGGRADQIKGRLASILSALHIHPILGFKDGKLDIFGRARNARKARMRMADMALARGTLTHLAVLHTNAPELGDEMRQQLAGRYHGPIEMVDAGPVLAVHAGERAVGVASCTMS